MKYLQNTDPKIFEVINKELNRQRDKIELIASENFTSRAVMEACGSVLTNKYAEGYPERRYYGGCEYVDEVEILAIERAKKLFGAEHVNVQSHSGTQANLAVYYAILKPGDTILSMNLSHGGHLSHGSPVTMSGNHYKIAHYGVNEETHQIDYDEIRSMAKTVKPKLILSGASAYPRIIDFKIFGEIAKEVGAYSMADIAHIAGMVATGDHPSPIPYIDFVTTTTHKTLRGPRGGMIMCKEEYAKIIDKAVFPGTQGGPFMHIIAGKAVAFHEALQDDYEKYISKVLKNANTLAIELQGLGVQIVSGGTDNHLMLIDLRNTQVTGKELELKLDEIGITVNKNAIPFDTQSPFITSGIRIGTPAITTRGMGELEMKLIAEIIFKAITDFENCKSELKAKVKSICDKFPLYE